MKKFSFCLLYTCLCISALSQKTIFVSVTANGSGNGSKQSPYHTIAQAQEKVRQLTGKVIVYLRGGNYYLETPIIFTTADSRKDNEEVTYKPYPGERVVLSSATPQRLAWKTYKGNIVVASVDTSLVWDALFVNGILQQMARYPNYNPTARIYGGTDSNATAIERVKQWQHPEGGYLHVMHKSEWGDFHYRITGKDANGQLKLEGGWQNNRQSGLHKTQRFVENIFEEMDTAHEWYMDRAAGLLYYYPPKEFSPATAIIQTPRLQQLVIFRGNATNPVRNITLEGIIFTHTLRTFMETKDPLLRSDWTIYRSGAIAFEGTERCIVRKSSFTELGGNAVFFNGYNRNDSVNSCEFQNIGASAVCFVGDTAAVRSPLYEYHQSLAPAFIDLTPGPKSNNYPANCVVYDNLIHHIGTIEKQVAGVQVSMSQGITISHNTIYNTPRAGININDGTWGGHIIAFNDVFNTVMETGDHGAFNSWGRDRYWHPNRDSMNSLVHAARDKWVLLDAQQTNIIRNNRFRCDHGWDIDLDDGSSNYHIYNNLLLNGGLKLREGFYRVAENNIIINNSFHPHVWFNNSEDVFRRNVVTTGYYPIRVTKWGKEVDHNLFLDSAGLITAQREGHDLHSTYKSGALVKTGKGIYQLSNDVTSNKLIVPFDQSQYGVVSAGLKKKAQKPVLPALMTNITASDTTGFEVFGLVVKHVTMGERSATGMDSERGVYISAIQRSSPFAKLLRPTDVLLMVNDKPVNDVKSLLEQKASLRFNKAIRLKIFRDQRMMDLQFVPE